MTEGGQVVRVKTKDKNVWFRGRGLSGPGTLSRLHALFGSIHTEPMRTAQLGVTSMIARSPLANSIAPWVLQRQAGVQLGAIAVLTPVAMSASAFSALTVINFTMI